MEDDVLKRSEAFLIYQDENGIAQVNVRFEGEDVWLPVELNQERTHKKFLLVRQEGSRSVNRYISHEKAKQKAIAEFDLTNLVRFA